MENQDNSKLNDDFDIIENTSFDKKEETENTNKDRFNYVLSKIPLMFFLLLFTDVKRSTDLDKHIKQSLVLFVIFIFSVIILAWFLSYLFFVWYIALSFYLAYNAYYFKYIELPWEKQVMEIVDKYIIKK